MNMVKCFEYLRGRLRTVVRVSTVVLVALVVMDAIPGLIGKEKAHTQLELLPGFWAVFGFLGCLLLIGVSKLLGYAGIVRPEGYYAQSGETTSDENCQ